MGAEPKVMNYRRDILSAAYLIFDIAKKKGFSDSSLITFAESCTGGLAAASLCSVPGISSFFSGSVVAYSNRIKTDILKVRQETLSEYGAVSAQCAAEMACGAARLFGAAYSVSITGIAGPGGGSRDKPVGTVWFALCLHGRVQRLKKGFYAGRSRYAVRLCAVRTALRMLVEEMGKT